MTSVPQIRIANLNEKPISPDGRYVLYWMIANRRSRYNFSLQHAVDLASELQRPLVILEALRCDYRWASDRIHRFVMQGMRDNRRAFAKYRVTYHAYVEPSSGHGTGLLQRMARDAAVVVTDDFPCFFIPRMLRVAARKVAVRLQAVDSNGILPMRAADKVFLRAHDFRRFLQKNLRPHLSQAARPDPLRGSRLSPPIELDRDIVERWPEASDRSLQGNGPELARFPIDHSVLPALMEGGAIAAENVLETFLHDRLSRYADDRNQPESDASSGLSPYLHFGHISAHDIFSAIADQENWSMDSLAEKANGSRDGWWGMSEPAEGFLDELITWREVGYNMCWQTHDYDRYASLPDWARRTLEDHLVDARDTVYSLQAFEQAETHDPLWNAAQRQLVREGKMHNYLRMLWGKKILEWTSCPQDAIDIMIELNNKYAVDGRNPNSYSGIFWVLGRYDRAWQERPIFGKIRYMSSDNTARKLKVKQYLQEYAADT